MFGVNLYTTGGYGELLVSGSLSRWGGFCVDTIGVSNGENVHPLLTRRALYSNRLFDSSLAPHFLDMFPNESCCADVPGIGPQSGKVDQHIIRNRRECPEFDLLDDLCQKTLSER